MTEPFSHRIRLAPSGIHVELEMPSGNWLTIPLNQHFATRIEMILKETARGRKPRKGEPGNPTAHAIEKAWDLPRVKRFNSLGERTDLTLEDLDL